tara:strand:- start:3043 stop:3351 length:309 start_codon:yes stop_codon:yes gene_type:complete
MKKLYVLSIILILIISTTLIKNSTKNIDKQIFQINENIRVLNSRNNLLKLEYNYLSAPERINQFKKKYFQNILFEKDFNKFGKIIIDSQLNLLKIIKYYEEY